MKQDNGKTKVIFRVYPEGDVIALMPDEPGSTCGTYHKGRVLLDCLSYMHVGQHGAAHYNQVCQTTRKAHYEEYVPLLKELTSEPFHYDVQVLENYRHRKGLL